MKLLKHFKERILDDVPYVINWRAYSHISALLLCVSIWRGVDLLGWNWSDRAEFWLDTLLLTLPLIITGATVLYYIVLAVLALRKKTTFPNPDADGMTEIVPFRWATFVLFTMVLGMADKLYELGANVSPKLYPFSVCFYAGVLVISEIALAARIFRKEIKPGNSDEVD